MKSDHWIQKIMGDVLGSSALVESMHVVSGGCINDARKVTLQDGSSFFIKLNRPECHSMFEAEELGIQALQEINTIKVPTPIQAGSNSEYSYLVLQWIEPGVKKQGFSQTLGQQLANLHHCQAQDRFGFDIDNYLGSTDQLNSWSVCWAEFFMEKRLGFQLKLAEKNGYPFLKQYGDRVLQTMESLIDRQPRPSLIHGDLWSGNFMVGLDQEPILIDPAPYWADREAEFGILTMFGGFDQGFFSAYQECYPLEPGFEERLPIYQLYHYLNHLNLFGVSYLEACQERLKPYR